MGMRDKLVSNKLAMVSFENFIHTLNHGEIDAASGVVSILAPFPFV